MADALALRIKQLIAPRSTFDLSDEGDSPDSTRMMTRSFDGLMNYLKEMMVGYENEEVLALLKQMEEAVPSKVLVRHEESHMMLDHVFNEFYKLNIDGHSSMTETRFNKGIKGRWDKVIVICEQLCNIRFNTIVEEEKALVGFDNEIETLLDQLTGTSSTKQFQIISITGMAGLGKTTLARKLYSHELVEYKFDVRAWACVSQVYQKKKLLLSILSSFIDDLTDEFYEMSEHQLGEKLYRKLKGRRYLVVLDDISDCRVWSNFKMYFPDDRTGSRVLFTSRDIDVTLHVQSARPAHVLRLRTGPESWDIFQKKVFRIGICPGGLEKSGRMINKKCKGLPLAIVIAAGVLKNNLSVTWWEQIAESLHSFMFSDPRQYIDSLALSYNHLPPHLRPCFLFLEHFPRTMKSP